MGATIAGVRYDRRYRCRRSYPRRQADGSGTAPLWVHDEFRIIGTLAKHAESRIEVKSRPGKTGSIRLDKQTAISRDDTTIDAAALRVGQSLVVDAYGDTEDGSLALGIRIVPPIRQGGVWMPHVTRIPSPLVRREHGPDDCGLVLVE